MSAPPRTRKGRRRVRRLFWSIAGVLFTAAVFPVVAQWWVRRTAEPHIYTRVEETPERPVGIVFGALVYPSGNPSPVLAERIRAGVALYKAGRVRKLLMTGDNGSRDYDEVTAMKAYAVKLGVPPRDIVRDFAGFRTYDSCYRARDIFDVREAVLITQRFHLPRAVFLARRLGIDAVGFVAEDGMSDASVARSRSRELGACFGAVLDVTFRRKPRYLGPREPLFANVQADR